MSSRSKSERRNGGAACCAAAFMMVLSDCRSFPYQGTMGPLPVCALDRETMTREVTAVAVTQCFARARFDAIADARQRRAVEEAVGTLCGMFSDAAFAQRVAARDAWFTTSDRSCETRSGAQFWDEFRASWSSSISFVRDDSQQPAATKVEPDVATVKVNGERIEAWNMDAACPLDRVVSRGRLINTLAHELVHVKPSAPGREGSYYLDTGGPQNDYVRSLLASYHFGDVAECWYIAQHSTSANATFDRCIDVRQNDRTLVPTTRSEYRNLCRSGDERCRSAVSDLSAMCRTAALR